MNNSFDEFLNGNEMSDETKRAMKELDGLDNQLKEILLLGILHMTNMDPFIIGMFKSLMKYGCPPDAIIKMMEEMIVNCRKERKDDDGDDDGEE